MLMPEILVFAGPNGSGKSTVTSNVEIVGEYINADEIKKDLNCSDLEAAEIATARRRYLITEGKSFTFETVLSSSINMDILQSAKECGYFLKCFYILTISPEINVQRVNVRVQQGGHDVPQDKIVSRYYKSLKQLPQLIELCDVIHIYDNSDYPCRIFKKRKDEYFFWESSLWTLEKIHELTQK